MISRTNSPDQIGITSDSGGVTYFNLLASLESNRCLLSPFLPTFLTAMSDAEKQLLLDEIHELFNNAISFNLYTGLAYGTSTLTV